MSLIYDEVFQTPEDRLIGFLIILAVSGIVGIIPYMAWLGGLILVHYMWWWWLAVERANGRDEWEIK